jgi:UDP-glucose:(heptosyl)LPS alpha-1,3-glucosyltransferase
MIAQDYQRKGLAEAILALSGQDQRLTLLVVGKQSPTRYAALARKVGVHDRVIFAGPTTDPYAFYKAADFFVLPTRHDPCSLVVLEALAMGLPVVSTIFNGACEIMTDATHGYILQDPRNVDTLKAAYQRMTDQPLRQKMSQSCLELRPRLSYVQHLHSLLNIYQAAHYRT